MEDSSNNNSDNLTNAVKGLKKFHGRKPGDFRDWHKSLAAVLGVTRRDIASLANGKTRSTKETSGTEISLGLAGVHGGGFPRQGYCRLRQVERRTLGHPIHALN